MSDDLISRQAAIKAIENLQDCYNGFSDTYDKACIIGALEEVPSAQSEIVRCRECKRWNTVLDRNKAEYGLCQNWSQLETTKADFFCADGERRSENDTHIQV